MRIIIITLPYTHTPRKESKIIGKNLFCKFVSGFQLISKIFVVILFLYQSVKSVYLEIILLILSKNFFEEKDFFLISK